jgi:hypothetical protein
MLLLHVVSTGSCCTHQLLAVQQSRNAFPVRLITTSLLTQAASAHYVLLAAKWGAYEYADRSSGSRPRSPLWLLSIPVALPGVVALDLMMLLTSVLPLMVRPRGKGASSSSGGSGGAAVLSSFLSNYNFTRLFLEFVCESVPQTVLQVRRSRLMQRILLFCSADLARGVVQLTCLNLGLYVSAREPRVVTA